MLSQKPFIEPSNSAPGVHDGAGPPVITPTPRTLDAWACRFRPGGSLDTPVSSIASTASGTTGAAPAVTGSTSTPGATTGSTATPSWISSLSDAVIKADMIAASAGGTVSEAGMAKLFTDLAAELTTNKTTLSASQLSDLQTIATNLNVGETASPYVTYITDALIQGNAANADWTGGAASATTLGNLAAGSTATQIGELVGKWFLGTDLPSSAVSMSGSSTFSVSYSAVTNPVFGASGPGMNDINQGDLGDCYLLASLAEVALQEPSLIQSMITDNGNNTYGVRFFVNGTAEYVTVNASLADSGSIFNRATDIWASLIEKAYAQLQDSGVITGNSINDGNSYSTIGNGGAPLYALEEITGASAITEFYSGGSTWSDYVCNASFSVQSTTYGLTTASVLATLVADLAQGDDIVLSSYTNATDSNGMTTLVASHAMSIYGYDSTTGNLEIRNPWGTESGQSWDTTFEVSLATLLAAGDSISVDNITSPTTPPAPPPPPPPTPVPAPTGVSVTPSTALLGAAQSNSGLSAKTALATVAEIGGQGGDAFTYTLGGAGAASFMLSSSGTLSTGKAAVAGGTNGKAYALTLTANDTTAGSSSAASAFDVVVGGSGGDTVSVETLCGGASAAATPTFIFGLAGKDALNGTGMTGRLYFVGGAGADTMTGGSGVNDYLYGATSDSTASAMDIISNFNAATDIIDLTGIGTTKLTYGGSFSGSKLAAHSIGYQVSGGNTYIYVNTSGSSEALTGTNMKIELIGSITLASANILHH